MNETLISFCISLFVVYLTHHIIIGNTPKPFKDKLFGKDVSDHKATMQNMMPDVMLIVFGMSIIIEPTWAGIFAISVLLIVVLTMFFTQSDGDS